MTEDDDKVLRMLAGANFGPGVEVVLPSGMRVDGSEAQALSAAYAEASELPDGWTWMRHPVPRLEPEEVERIRERFISRVNREEPIVLPIEHECPEPTLRALLRKWFRWGS